jgi:hypothetical protein
MQDPHIPGNYESGDSSTGENLLEQNDAACVGTYECRMCKNPHVLGHDEPGDASQGFGELEQLGTVWEDIDECRMRTRSGQAYWPR